jgi:hypothetical protein
MATWVPVLAAITAAAAGLLGYWLTSRSKQLDAKAKAYADALSAIEAYKSLPYRITRRAKDGKDESDLQHLVGDIEQQVAFYRRWLALESATVGLAYEALANRVMKNGANDRRHAWAQEADPTSVTSGFVYSDELEQGVCLAAMRHDLGRRRRGPGDRISHRSSEEQQGRDDFYTHAEPAEFRLCRDGAVALSLSCRKSEHDRSDAPLVRW